MAEAARRVGVSPDHPNPTMTWKRWETGERRVPLQVVARIEKMSEGRVRATHWPQAHPERRAAAS